MHALNLRHHIQAGLATPGGLRVMLNCVQGEQKKAEKHLEPCGMSYYSSKNWAAIPATVAHKEKKLLPAIVEASWRATTQMGRRKIS
jgi:hypothetical protein